jgi:hypothetical protein
VGEIRVKVPSLKQFQIGAAIGVVGLVLFTEEVGRLRHYVSPVTEQQKTETLHVSSPERRRMKGNSSDLHNRRCLWTRSVVNAHPVGSSKLMISGTT